MDATDTLAKAHVSPLRLWSLTTFHTASFVAAAVIGLHIRGALLTALSRLDTSLGVASFLSLWALTWYATRAGVRQMGPRIEAASSATIVFSTTVAGGLNGVGILAIVPVLAVMSAVSYGVLRALGALPVLFLFVVIGGVLAFTIGAVVGLIYGLIDALLLKGGAALFRWTQGDRV